jgi:hypothetical protein
MPRCVQLETPPYTRSCSSCRPSTVPWSYSSSRKLHNLKIEYPHIQSSKESIQPFFFSPIQDETSNFLVLMELVSIHRSRLKSERTAPGASKYHAAWETATTLETSKFTVQDCSLLFIQTTLEPIQTEILSPYHQQLFIFIKQRQQQ